MEKFQSVGELIPHMTPGSNLDTCPECGEPVQMRLSTPFNREIIVPRACKCKRDEQAIDAYRHDREIKQMAIDAYRDRWDMNTDEVLRQTFDTWVFEDNESMNPLYDICREYAFGFPQHPKRGLLLTGWQNGTGKSHLLNAVANYVSQVHLIPVITVEVPVMVRRIRPFQKHRDGVDVDYFADLMRVPLLVLNDLAACKTTDWVMEQMFVLLEARRGKATCVSMNENPFDWAGDNLSLNRIRSRLEEACDWRAIPEEAIDYRGLMREKRKKG